MRRIPDEHLDEETLEAYALGSLRGARIERAEEHLLICRECLDRLHEVEGFVRAMREASADLVECVVITHRTQDGPVRLQALKQGSRWRAQFDGPQLEGADTFPTFKAAYAYLEKSFAELYPRHRCTDSCRHEGWEKEAVTAEARVGPADPAGT